MGKYGNGMSLKSMLLYEWEEIDKILKKYNVSAEDYNAIKDNYQDKCYQLCHINASACYFEDMFKQLVDEDVYRKFTLLYIQNFAGYKMEKMMQTFPWYGDDDSDIGAETYDQDEISEE